MAAKNAEDAKEHEYGYDDIGNRTSSSDFGTARAYTANSLNQYTEISTLRASAPPRETFIPQFDDDGNQTLIQTKTGVWSVTYNGENRPIAWSSGSTNIVMKFDRMGRRVSYTETVGVTTNAHRTFTYDNYLEIADNIGNRYLWDPTEPIATRPLAFITSTFNAQPATHFYTHDGNKNVSELVDDSGVVTAHYEYAPFGDVTAAVGNLAYANHFRFSSEYADDTLGLVYYNYRHYEPVTGRWMSRDKLELFTLNLYSFVNNANSSRFDYLGLSDCCKCGQCQIKILKKSDPVITDYIVVSGHGKKYRIIGSDDFIDMVVEKYFDDIYKAADRYLEIINKVGSFGKLLQPRLRVGIGLEIERRDCKHLFWFLGPCDWWLWEKNIMFVHSEWHSPEVSDNYDRQEITNWISVFERTGVVEKIRELYDSAKKLAEEEISVANVAEHLSKKTGCEVKEENDE